MIFKELERMLILQMSNKIVEVCSGTSMIDMMRQCFDINLRGEVGKSQIFVPRIEGKDWEHFLVFKKNFQYWK